MPAKADGKEALVTITLLAFSASLRQRCYGPSLGPQTSVSYQASRFFQEHTNASCSEGKNQVPGLEA